MLRRQEGGARGTGDGAVGQSGEAGGLGSALGTGTGPLERGRGPLASQFCPSSRRLWPEALQIAELEGRWKLAWGSRARNVPWPDARGVFHGARRVCVFLTRRSPHLSARRVGEWESVIQKPSFLLTDVYCPEKHINVHVFIFIWGFPEVICPPPVGHPRAGAAVCSSLLFPAGGGGAPRSHTLELPVPTHRLGRPQHLRGRSVGGADGPN